MAQMSRNIFVLFLLCVVLLIIVGVAFPSYLSRKNIKLRSTFNSSFVSFNSVSSEKLIFKSPENNIINTSESSVLSRSNKIATEINVSYGTSNSSLMPINVKRRAKRHTSSSNGSELFSWNFKINVTRYRKPNEEISEGLNTSVAHSGVAVYLESKEPKEIAFNEMQAAFKSAKSFLIDFFKVSYENATTDIVEKKKVKYFTESPWVEPDHTTIDSFGDDGNTTVLNQPDIIGNETSHSLNKSLQSTEQVSSENIDGLKSELRNNDSTQTDREARIFFGLFSLGGKSLRKTTSEPETTLTTVEDKDRNIELSENVTDQFPHEAMFVSIKSQHSTSIHTDSFRSETERSKIQPNEQISDKSDLLFVTQQADCLNCNTDKSEISNLPNEHDSSKTALETSKPIEHITDKTLRNLCMQILSNLKESQTPFSGKENDVKDQLRSSQNLSIDSLNSLIPKEVKELDTHTEIDDSFFVSSEESPTENALSLGKQARFLNIFGLGSGRSEIINERNLIFEKEPDEPNFTNLPSISDCEKFSEDWNSELVLNRNHTSDLNTTHNIHELVFLENDPNQVSEDKNIDENKTSLGTEVSLVVKDLPEVRNENKENENIENNENLIELAESQTINSRQNVQDATDGQRDGRIFSFFDFGSGNGRDASMNDNLRFLGLFGSGMRSLDSRESDESNDLGSGIPFQEKVSVDENYSSEKDAYEDVGVTFAQERRFLGIFGIGGSGERRNIADSTDFITEYNIHINCENDCSHGATEQPYDCSDNCDLDYDVSNNSTEFSQTDSKGDCKGNCNTSIVEMHGKDFENLTSESFGLDFSLSSENFLLKISEAEDITNEATDVGCDDCDYDNFINYVPETEAPYVIERTVHTKNIGFGEDHDDQIHSRESTEDFGLNYSTEKFDYEQNNENSAVEHGTTEKIRRFMGTIFLTGSGDGGLFGDDGGPINLVEEENSVGSNRNPRRRGRLDDASLDDFVLLQNTFDSSDENPGSQVSNPHDIVSFTDRTRDRVEPDENEAVDSSTPFLLSPNITEIRNPIKLRSCSGARHCNDTLNERCLTVSASSICDCGRSFVRHKKTRKCVAKSLVETSLKLPGESFDEDLRNPASPRYKQMSEKSIETIYLLLNETPNILRVVTDINVAGFASGSLIVKLNFVFATEKDNPPESLKYMENELQKALKYEKVLKRASLNVTDASFQPLIIEVDRCKSLELNYCSKYADCVWKEDYPGFICKCKEHYLDVSANSFYPGEICVAKCPASFCGSHGHCEVLDNEKRHCVCYGLYFGEKCEYPGVVIIGSLSIVALISLIVVFVVMLKLGYKSSNYGRTPTFRRAETPGHAIANCRLSDAIALEESRSMKVSKFSQISTPVPEPPLIKVTRPTLNESSISFECDSTFDMSNNTYEKTV